MKAITKKIAELKPLEVMREISMKSEDSIAETSPVFLQCLIEGKLEELIASSKKRG